MTVCPLFGTSPKYVTALTGETAAEGGAREAREEAGVTSFIGELRLLRVEQTESRFRWILHARAATDVLKTEPDDESEGARWVTLRECASIDSGTMIGIDDCYLRGDEPMKWFEYVALGRPSFALSDFVQATTEKGAIAFHNRALYHTSSDGRIAVVRKSTGLIAAFRDSGALRTVLALLLIVFPIPHPLSGSFRLPSTAIAPHLSELQTLTGSNQLSPAADLLASSISAPRPTCICGMQMLQRADGTASFVAVFGVEEHVDEQRAPRIAAESDAVPNASGLQWIAVASLTDAFERDCVNRLLQHRVMPRSVLVHDMGDDP